MPTTRINLKHKNDTTNNHHTQKKTIISQTSSIIQTRIHQQFSNDNQQLIRFDQNSSTFNPAHTHTHHTTQTPAQRKKSLRPPRPGEIPFNPAHVAIFAQRKARRQRSDAHCERKQTLYASAQKLVPDVVKWVRWAWPPPPRRSGAGRQLSRQTSARRRRTDGRDAESGGRKLARAAGKLGTCGSRGGRRSGDKGRLCCWIRRRSSKKVCCCAMVRSLVVVRLKFGVLLRVCLRWFFFLFLYDLEVFWIFFYYILFSVYWGFFFSIFFGFWLKIFDLENL